MSYTSGQFIYTEVDGVATVRLDRLERRNALTPDGYRDLRAVAADVRARPEEVRVLVLEGGPGIFCAGGDLDETAALLLNAGPRANYEFMKVAGDLVRDLREMAQPVVAVVDGPAVGAGAALVLASDLRVLTPRASISFVFTRIGLSGGDMGTAWMLQRLVGQSTATELLMLGSPIDAKRAERLGLAHSVVDPEELEGTVQSLLEDLIASGRWGLQLTKEILNRTAAVDLATALDMETWSQSLLMTAQDFSVFQDQWLQTRAAKQPDTSE